MTAESRCVVVRGEGACLWLLPTSLEPGLANRGENDD